MKATLLLLAFIVGSLAQLNIPMSPRHIFDQGIPVTFFGPPASSRINPDLLGPVQLLPSTIQVDLEAGTIRLPLYHGIVGGEENQTDQWFILTEVNNQDAANAFGINWSYKLGLVPQDALRTATINQDQIWNFESGIVDFTPELDVVSSDNNEFPPSQDTQAGSMGDNDYSPLVLVNNWIFHAPVVASGSLDQLNEFCDGITSDTASDAYTMVHDQVLAICPRDNFVTLKMTLGFSFGKPVFYLGMGSNNMILAAMENATFIPRWSSDMVINTGCGDKAVCDIERAFAIINGYTNNELEEVAGQGQNVTLPPLRQGLNSALLGEGDALHVFGEVPTIGLHYSPLWDIHTVEWTQEAINNGFRTRLMDMFHLLSFVRGNWLTSTGGAEVESMNVVLAAPMVHRVY